MVETKSIRIENWGSHFLQKLQVFFSKTDYCDLTLQFEGNVQLKVHRLVMNACTEYFTYLEQACPALEENTIMMPPDLQADVIVPIVNFMYTGMLEYNPVLFERLYKATQQMKIGVLIQMMEAQLHKPALKKNKPVHQMQNNDHPDFTPARSAKPSSSNSDFPPPLPGRKLPVWKRRLVPRAPTPPTHPVSATFTESKWSSHPPPDPDPLFIDTTAKPTRFEWPDEDLPTINLMDTSFEDITYNSKPLLTKEEEQKASTSFACKKIKTNPDDLEDEEGKQGTGVLFVEESQLEGREEPQKRKAETAAKSSQKRIKISESANETMISIKSNSMTDVDHSKIVSEILKKYPQLVKKNKNIRLKIMSKTPKEEEVEKAKPAILRNAKNKNQTATTPAKMNIEMRAEQAAIKARASKANINEDGPWTCLKCVGGEKDPPEFVLYYLYRKHMVDVHNDAFDPKLCKYCGKRCENNLLMMYHLFTKHGLKPAQSYNFPKCDRCPYIAYSDSKITQHKSQHQKEEIRCNICKLTFKNQGAMAYHVQNSGHTGKYKQSHTTDCQYCLKKLTNPVNLFSHLKTQHYREAKADGIVSLDETMDVESPEILEDPEILEENGTGDSPTHKDKVKIISNVKLPKQDVETSIQVSDGEGLANVDGNIAASLGLVDIVVLDENQQQFILQQQQNQSGDTEYILPTIQNSDGTFNTQVITTQSNAVIPQGVLQTEAGADMSSTDELVMVLTDHDYQDEQSHGVQHDNSNIVVLYSHPVDGQQGQFITSQGNLLVSSQSGMLEIRNGGATIATTETSEGEVLLNHHTDSPVESIEMIQREIEGHSTTEHKPDVMFEADVKPDIEKEPDEPETSQEPEQTEKEDGHQDNEEENVEEAVQEMEEHLEETEQQLGRIKEHLEKVQENVQSSSQEEEVKEQSEEQGESEDTVDNAGDCMQEEPMEVEDIAGPAGEIKENVQQQEGDLVQETSDAEEHQPENETPVDQVEETTEQPIEENPPVVAMDPEEETCGVDVPPEPKSNKEEQESNEETNVIQEDNQEKKESVEPEPMEVDGGVKENLEESVIEEVLELNTETEHITSESTAEEKQEHEEEIEIPEADKSTEEMEHFQESVDEVDTGELSNSLEESEEHHNLHEEIENLQEETAQEVVQTSKINRAILQDWGEDTDSQHSEKEQKGDDAEEIHQERVNKLVDDWEEEEEEDKSRGE